MIRKAFKITGITTKVDGAENNFDGEFYKE